jgi:hypothetical protein
MLHRGNERPTVRRAPSILLGAALLAASTTIPSRGAISPTVRTASKAGHPTHPVWYHDDVAVRVGARLVFAWNATGGSVQARTWNLTTSRWSAAATTVSATKLNCRCTDSTGTNPNRHDVPTVFSDPVGRVYAIYGGGTASHTGPQTGPFFRAAATTGAPLTWGSEQRLSIPGAMYDLEVARDNLGVNHLIGQQGDNANGAGSLLYLRVPPGTSSSPATPQPARVLVNGGWDPSACGWQTTPGCNIYVIGRLVAGPADPAQPTTPSPLFLTWGWTEKNLSGTCGDPAGYCDRGLYFAKSLDGGTHWVNADGTASIDVTTDQISYGDPRFGVVGPTKNVGLFKAIAVTGHYPGTPWIAYQPRADMGAGRVAVTRWNGSSWAAPTVVDRSRAWNNHLIFRAYTDGRLVLWSDIAQTGSHATELAQWTLASAWGSWRFRRLSVGANWFLTGRPAGALEVLVWRAPAQSSGRSRVRFALLPEPS